jgi:hypothetical protein
MGNPAVKVVFNGFQFFLIKKVIIAIPIQRKAKNIIPPIKVPVRSTKIPINNESKRKSQ